MKLNKPSIAWFKDALVDYAKGLKPSELFALILRTRTDAEVLRAKAIRQRVLRKWRDQRCKKKYAERRKRWLDNGGRKIMQRNVSKHKLRFPGKDKARKAVKQALNSGLLIRPSRCESCSKKTKVHGHHPDYRKKLLVKWLCLPCHTKEHHE